MRLGNLVVVIFVALIVLAVAARAGHPWGLLIILLGLLAIGVSALLWGFDSRDWRDSTSTRARRREP